jgi:glutaredoxin
MAKHMPLIERFFQKVDKSGSEKFPDCWIWTGAPTSRNYGSFSYFTKKPAIGAHVASYLFHKGEIPDGQIVRHNCDNPPCVNPEHLILGTHSDNMKDMFERGRNGSSTKKRTHCYKGHLFEEFGVYERKKKNGKTDRICRQCQRDKALKKRHSPETRDAHLKKQREYQREYYRKNKQNKPH